MKDPKVACSLFVLLCMAVGLQYASGSPLHAFKSLARACALASPPGLPVAAAPQLGNVLWSADMENVQNPGSGLSQWYAPEYCEGGCAVNNGGGVFNSGIASASPSFDVARIGGQYSAMLKISTPSIPESGTRLFRWLEPRGPLNDSNTTLYYSAWYYFPQRYTPTGSPAWWNLMQWKSESPTSGNNPFFTVNVWNRADGTMYFFLKQQLPTPINHQQPQPIGDITVGAWTRIDALYICSGTNAGRVTLWKDGVLVADVMNVQTRYPDGDCSWSVNNYSSGLTPNPATIYVDDAAICEIDRCPDPLP